MGLALESNQQRLLSLGMGALAAVCTAYGINDLQRFEPDLDAAIAQAYQAGDDNKQTTLTESRKAKMDGMGALVLGAALGIGGWLTASHEKNNVSPTESARVQPQTRLRPAAHRNRCHSQIQYKAAWWPADRTL